MIMRCNIHPLFYLFFVTRVCCIGVPGVDEIDGHGPPGIQIETTTPYLVAGLANTKQSTNLPLKSCEEVLAYYNYVNFKVIDCTELNGFLYWRLDNCINWHEAQEGCRSILNADLASVHNFDERRLVHDLAGTPSCHNDAICGAWIGLIRGNMSCDEQFIWSDGSKYGYNFWSPDQPNCHESWGCQQIETTCEEEKCVHVWPVVKGSTVRFSYLATGWNDANCLAQMPAICKMKTPVRESGNHAILPNST